MSKLNSTFIIFILIILLIIGWDLTNFSSKLLFLNKLDYHNIGYYFSAIITGLITFGAMWFIDEQNKKRWEKDGFFKTHTDNWIKLRKGLVDLLNNTRSHRDTIVVTPIPNNQKEYFNSAYTHNEAKEKAKKYEKLSFDLRNICGELDVIWNIKCITNKEMQNELVKFEELWRTTLDDLKQNPIINKSVYSDIDLIQNEPKYELYEEFINELGQKMKV